MKKILFILSILAASQSYAADSFPKFYSDLTITGIETWPNATDPTYGFMVRVQSGLEGTGCTSPTVFSVKTGDYQDHAMTVLLTALTAGKKVRVRVTECSDRPLVDRVEILG